MKKILTLLTAATGCFAASATPITVYKTNTIDGVDVEFRWFYDADLTTKTATLLTVNPSPYGELEIPEVLFGEIGGITYSFAVTEIGARAFENARALKKVSLGKDSADPEKGTVLQKIGDYAFSNCTALASIELGYALRYIGKRPFVNTAIRELTLPDTLLEMDGNIAAGTIYDMTINISDSSHFTYSDDGVLYNKDMTKLYSCPTRAEGTVIIPNSVTNICTDAFFGCFRLTYLNIPENVNRIEEDAFNVKGIWPGLHAPESVPKLQYIFYEGEYPIPNAAENIYTNAPSSLTNFVFNSNWPTNELWKGRPVVFIPRDADDDDVNIPILSSKDSYGITWFYRIIKGSAQIYNEDRNKKPIAAIDPSSISGVLYQEHEDSDTFAYALRVPHSLNGFAVTSIGKNAFAGCKALTCVGLPASIQKIGDNAFKDCTALRSIDEYFSAPFYVTEGQITLPVGITTIGYHAFEGATVTSIFIPYTLTTTTGNPLAGLDHLATVEVDPKNSNFSANSNVLYDKQQTTVIGVPKNYNNSSTSISFPVSVKKIGPEALYGCKYLQTIRLPDYLETISTNAFSGCSSIKSIIILETVNEIGEAAFTNCTALTNVTYSGDVPKNVDTNIYNGAINVTSMVNNNSEVIISNWVSSAVITNTITTNNNDIVIKTYMGSWMERPIIIIHNSESAPSTPKPSVTIGDITWYYDYNTTNGTAEISAVESAKPIMNLTLPDTLGGYIVKGIGNGALSGLRGITSIAIPNTYEWIGDNAFSNCTSLASISLGKGIEKIGHWPFFGTKLTTLEIPDSVSEIDGNPVAGCAMMTALSVSSVQPYFSVNDGLLYDKKQEALIACPATKTSLSLPSTLETVNDDAFYGCNFLYGENVMVIDGVTWGFSINDDGTAKITAVQGATGTITIPAALGGHAVTEIAEGVFADCTNVTDFVSKASAFKTRSGVLYSADGKELIRVPDTMILPYTVTTARTTATVTETSEAGVRNGLPYVDVTTTTNATSTKVSTAQVSGDISFESLLAGVTRIRDFAFAGVNILTNTYVSTAGEPSAGWAIPSDDGKVNSQIVTTTIKSESVTYATAVTINTAKTTVGKDAFAESGISPTLIYKPNGTLYKTSRPIATSTGTNGDTTETTTVADGLPPANAASTYYGYLTDADGDLAGTIQVKVAKPRKGAAKVTATLLPVGGRKTTAKGTLDMASGTVAGLDLALGERTMAGSLGGCKVSGVRNLFASRDKQEVAQATETLVPWLGAINVAWPEAMLTVTVAAKGKVRISGVRSDGTKVSATSQLLIGEDWLCVPVVVTKKTSFAFLLWLPLDGGEPMVEGLDEAHVGQPGALAPNAAFDVDRDSIEALVIAALSSRVPYAGTVLTDELPIGTIQRNGVQWRAGLTEATALNLRCIEKTGTFKGSFKVRAVLGKKTTTISVSVNGVLANGIGYGTAIVRRAGHTPISIK